MFNILQRKGALTCLFIAFLGCFVFIKSAEIRQLPFCDHDTSENNPPRSLVFVSTLDGKVTALDIAHQGRKAWTVDLGRKIPVFSSNIHQRELNNHGQWVRLIPSLNGRLYKFDGENLEAVTLSAKQLLESSLSYSDLVFSGSEEVVRYGVYMSTGKVLYECGSHKCKNTTEEQSNDKEEVLVIRRRQKIIRALNPESGYERWNYSVGLLEFSLASKKNLDCHDKKTKISLDIEIRAIVPEGLLWAVDRNNQKLKLWEYKFNSPIMSVWKEESNYEANGYFGVKEINLFEISQRLWDSEFAIKPGLYLGMHNQQLYVQENPALSNILEPLIPSIENIPKFPWNPYPAIAFSGNDEFGLDNANALGSRDDVKSTALSVLYSSNYINENGFYLYSKEQLIINSQSQCKNMTIPQITDVSEEHELSNNKFEEKGEETLVPAVTTASLWFWWKEVLLISITTAILLNFMVTQRLFNASSAVKEAMFPPCIIETHVEKHIEKKEEIPKATLNSLGSEYSSRFLEEYDPIGCLGKGGYGCVFEVRNKLDRRLYAIKRITLPSSLKSRERVLREVLVLAQLEHENIVRYFIAWIECPPAGWQEEKDKELPVKDEFSNCDVASSVSASDIKSNSVYINLSPSDQSSLDSACEAYDLNNKNDDSFIVFEANESDAVEESQEFTQDYDESNAQVSEISESARGIEGTKSSEIKDIDVSNSVIFQISRSKSKTRERKKRKDSLSLNVQYKGTNIGSNANSAKMYLYIQMQLCEKNSLSEWLKKEQTRDIKLVLNTFQQIVNAVQYVHLQGLIHRDLKPSNIFVSFDKKVKIGDFGLVAMTESYNEVHTPGDGFGSILKERGQHTSRVGTDLYMSPEQKNGQRYNFKVDIYSLGIILVELLIPFGTQMERVNTLLKVRDFEFPKGFELQYPIEFSLIKMMLDVDPSKRPTTAGITARMRFVDQKTLEEVNSNEMAGCHFDWPESEIKRHSSVTSNSSSSNSLSWELR